MKKDPRLNPEQSCGTMRLIDDVRLSPVAEREMESRNSDCGGCEMFKGLYTLMSRYVLAARELKMCDCRE
jgi:hypothetical protein